MAYVDFVLKKDITTTVAFPVSHGATFAADCQICQILHRRSCWHIWQSADVQMWPRLSAVRPAKLKNITRTWYLKIVAAKVRKGIASAQYVTIVISV